MAEAHSAVAFSFSITHDGYNFDYNREVLNLVWDSGVRSWKKRLARFRNAVHNGVYPAHLQSLWIVISVAVILHWSGYNVPLNLVNRILPLLPDVTPWWQLIACSLSGLIFWLCICYTMRYTLKLLLMYKGWMYETRGKGAKVSLATRIWAVATKVLSNWNTPGLYSFQGSLPRLPLPSVKDTTQRYLRSVRPLLDDKNYEHMVELAKEFETTLGLRLQMYLVLKSWWSSNYVSDWWEEYVYLRGRGPLMINSNFYGIDAIYKTTTHVQAARAANVTHLLLIFRRMVERQELEPIMVQGLVPLCSWQYERIFNTVRVPGESSDKIVHYGDSNHIVVLHKGCYYKVIIYYRGRLLRPCEIQIQMEAILNSTDNKPAIGEERLAALTAGDRNIWANARNTQFNKGVNRTSLHAIESAAFIISLDDEPFEFDINQPEKLDHFGAVLLHGTGCDRWFDKSFTVCIGSNGRLGFNSEHTWGDAAVMAHIWEHIIIYEAVQDGADAPVSGHMWEFILGSESVVNRYDENGNTKGTKQFDPPAPIRLPWALDNDGILPVIERAYLSAQEQIRDIDLRILVHNQYGKGFMKTCRVSPDAYIQMALQLAYYRDAGKFSLTYEASMTRLYREGRTETVRPCTIESSAWVNAMVDGKLSAKERVDLLHKACLQHQLGYQNAMCGKGIDRHLFCLYVVSKYLETKSPFLEQAVVNAKWQLSTSQTPHGQTNLMDLRKHPDCISAGGGFGPVADDGYGVSYIIAGEDLIFFHISSKRACNTTNSSRFANEIVRSLDDIRHLFEEYNNDKKMTNGTTTKS